MRTQHRTIITTALASGLLLLAQAGMAAVTATPSTVTFTNQDQSAEVVLSHNGQSVGAGTIGSVQFLATGSNYAHMIAVTATPTGLRIAPTERLEVGSYDLIVETSHGPVQVMVYAPLSDLRSILDEADGPGGVRRQALREELGFSARTSRAAVDIQLPPVYTVGQTLSLEMEHHPAREYVWAINGEVLQRGLGESSFQYTFTETGDYILSYAEREGGATVAQAEAATRVGEPPSHWHPVTLGITTEFTAPEGYTEYRWYVDGELMGNSRSFSTRFERVGEHIVTLNATRPDSPPYIRRYRTIVE